MLEKITDKIFTRESSESPAINQEDIDSLNELSSFKEAAQLLSGAVFLRNKAEQVNVQEEEEMIKAYEDKLIEIMFPQPFLGTLPADGITYKPHIHPQRRKTSATLDCSYEKDGKVQVVRVEIKGYREPGKDGWLEYVDFNINNSYAAEDVVPVSADATLLEVRDMVRNMVYELFIDQELYPKNY